jgi:fused signal recognition particle receptor
MSETTVSPRNWFARMKQGLGRTSSRLVEGIGEIFNRRRIDESVLREFEDLLIAADLGPAPAAALVEELRRTRLGTEVSGEEIRVAVAETIAARLAAAERPFTLDSMPRPAVILLVGVNGSGKTTTAAKLAHRLRAEGRTVLLVAGDTFRAAAVEQLRLWGERLGVEVVFGPPGADSASLAHQGYERGRKLGLDAVIIDTAGRLHTKADLMAELAKIVRVLRKLDAAAPHACLLVVDATIGQNLLPQIAVFQESAPLSGLVLTKLDGSAKGGVIVAAAAQFGLPVPFVGVGEGADDLRPFSARDFARALMGIDA